MGRKVLALLIAVLIPAAMLSGKEQRATRQEDTPSYRTNSCVNCHSAIATPVALSNRYFEWHSSIHEERGIGCDKCHGGNPATGNKNQAHEGVLPARQMQSRTHWLNLPETCRACHEGVVSEFVKSRHYQNLRPSGMGPSCSTCHGHMGSKVVMTPTETESLCAHCHDTINGLLPARPEIPAAAQTAMQSLNRANVAVAWVESLMKKGEALKMDLRVERLGFTAAKGTLKDAKVSWHAFDIEATRRKADDAFAMGMKLKGELEKKLGY
ncbi:MAG TPA: multiheme c-type cytochrome [Blastocatellia bacterium]|nr:multiheme c-type cytochrome [Blastocatellia bacterium]